MKLVEICSEEWYPVLDVIPELNPTKYTCEIPDELYNRWEKLLESFEEIQTELSKYYKPKKWDD